MRSLLTALLACLFVVMVNTDRFVCRDGCTDEPPAQATSQRAPSSCAICHGWSQAPIVMAARPAPRPVMNPLAVVFDPSEPALSVVERPPKTA